VAGPAWKGKVLEESKRTEKSEKSEVLEGLKGEFGGAKRPRVFGCNYLHIRMLQRNYELMMGFKLSNMIDLLGI